MPHLPDHATHDAELIAAFAAGDATGPALDEATALVAECAACAELHRDLRAITTALPELPPPTRTRDFRLSDAQADALRPSGWRGLVAAFASPRFRLAAPLGTGLAAAGLAGLLLATPGGVFVTGSASLPAGGCQLSSSSSGYGWTGRRLRARWMSIAALIAIRWSHDLTLPPRNEVRLRNAEKNASWTQSDAWSRSGTIRTMSANSWSW